jgi:sialic acid synthase SpsE
MSRFTRPVPARSTGSKPWSAWRAKASRFFVATGASTIGEVQKAVHAILKINKQLVLMQCNTNYTASPDNYDHLHLNVLKTYATMFPDVILGLSDHTHAVAPVVGAVTLGARVIERHFTDSNDREGPDHKFAWTPKMGAHGGRNPPAGARPRFSR